MATTLIDDKKRVPSNIVLLWQKSIRGDRNAEAELLRRIVRSHRSDFNRTAVRQPKKPLAQ